MDCSAHHMEKPPAILSKSGYVDDTDFFLSILHLSISCGLVMNSSLNSVPAAARRLMSQSLIVSVAVGSSVSILAFSL